MLHLTRRTTLAASLFLLLGIGLMASQGGPSRTLRGQLGDCGDGVCEWENPIDCPEDCPQSCGDGWVTGSESCDPGVGGNIPPCGSNGFCGQDCQCHTNTCGDGVIGLGEECDTYNTCGSFGLCDACQCYICYSNGMPLPGVGNGCCSCVCTTAGCGVACLTSCGGQSSTSTAASCGDGVVSGAEVCDTGSANGRAYCTTGAYCENNCTSCNARCGDGLVGPGEVCDSDGVYNWNCPAGWHCDCQSCTPPASTSASSSLASSEHTSSLSQASSLSFSSDDSFSSSFSASCTPSCIDYDGNNPAVAGMVEALDSGCNRTVYEDECIDEIYVAEYTCAGLNVWANYLLCTAGVCQNGGCYVAASSWSSTSRSSVRSVSSTSNPSRCSSDHDCDDHNPCTYDDCIYSTGMCINYPNFLCSSSSSSFRSSSPSCIDSDGGMNIGVWGSAQGGGVTLEDVCADSRTNMEAYCTASGPKITASACPGECVGGLCHYSGTSSSYYSPSHSSSSQIPCIDSDGGLNPTVLGTATGNGMILEDFCSYGNTVMEAYCSANGPVAEQIQCSGSCADGVCNAQPACTDSDGGLNYGSAGSARAEIGGNLTVIWDRCATSWTLAEAYCTTSGAATMTVTCPNQCVADGYCLPASSSSSIPFSSSSSVSTCTDSDGGLNYTVWGYAQGLAGSTMIADRCLDGINLAEAYCSPAGPFFVSTPCPGSCQGGVCVTGASSSSSQGFQSSSQSPPISCTDSDGGLSPAVWGYAVGSNGTMLVDQCSGATTIIEAYCSASGPTTLSATCPNACQAGVCVASILSSSRSSSSSSVAIASISSSSVAPQSLCGNGIREPGESCEPGTLNCPSGLLCDWISCACITNPSSIPPASYPSSTPEYVTQSFCGDGVLDPGEQCESGISCSQGWSCGIGCQCLPPAAVPSPVQSASSSSALPVTLIPSPPALPLCGNGILEIGEGCDSGIFCFRGICDNCRCVAPASSSSPQASSARAPASSASSLAAVCGNGQADSGEQCDDGSRINGDGCSSLCQFESGFACFGRPSRCLPVCGDGISVFPEECDDGNALDGDGCSSVCGREHTAAPFLSSSTSRSFAFCGNGLVEIGEQCDDRNVFDGDGCSHLCLFDQVIVLSSSSAESSVPVVVSSSSSSVPVLKPSAPEVTPQGKGSWLWIILIIVGIIVVGVIVLLFKKRGT